MYVCCICTTADHLTSVVLLFLRSRRSSLVRSPHSILPIDGPLLSLTHSAGVSTPPMRAGEKVVSPFPPRYDDSSSHRSTEE